MALRIIRNYHEEDTILCKRSDTMYQVNGAGLVAPQIGILKRLVVIDVGYGLIKLINPVIIEESGEQQGLGAGRL